MTTKDVIKPLAESGKLPASFGNIRVDTDLKMAKAELLQGLSKKLKPESGFPKLRIGMIVNSITGAVLPDSFIPFYVHREFIEEEKNDKGMKDIVFRTDDPNDAYVAANSHWTGPKDGRVPPKVQPWYTVFALFGENPDRPLTVLFKNTSAKAATDMLDKAYGYGGELYEHTYKLQSQLHKNGNNYIYNVTEIGKTDKKLIALAQEALAGVTAFATATASSGVED